MHYFGQESGLIFVIDGLCDHECLELTRQEMQKILNLEHFKDKPWLILCNKQDVEGASTAQKVQVLSILNLHCIKDYSI